MRLGLGLGLSIGPLSSFHPSQVGGMVGWWSADDGVTTSGSNVTQWNDRSGNGRHLTPPGNSPTLVAGAYNGLPTVRYVGASQQALRRDNVNLVGNGPYTLFVVGKSSSNNQWQAMNQTTNANGHGYWNNGTFRSAAHSGIASFDDGTLGGALEVFSINRAAASKPTARLNGTPVALSGSATTLNDPGATAKIVFGATVHNGVFSQYFTGDHTEIVWFNRALTALEETSMVNWLRTKWAI